MTSNKNKVSEVVFNVHMFHLVLHQTTCVTTIGMESMVILDFGGLWLMVIVIRTTYTQILVYQTKTLQWWRFWKQYLFIHVMLGSSPPIKSNELLLIVGCLDFKIMNILLYWRSLCMCVWCVCLSRGSYFQVEVMDTNSLCLQISKLEYRCLRLYNIVEHKGPYN